MRVSPENQEKHLDFLEKTLSGDDNAVFTNNTGVGDHYAERNRASLKNAQKTKTMPTLKKEELDELMAESFPEFTPELQKQFAELFAASSNKLRDGICELFSENPLFALLLDDDGVTMDVVEAFAQEMEDLEDAIAAVEAENEMLAAELHESQKQLQEEALFAASASNRKPKRSLDLDDYVDESNIQLMESGMPDQHLDPAMRARINYIEATVPPGRNTAGPNDALLETWKLLK